MAHCASLILDSQNFKSFSTCRHSSGHQARVVSSHSSSLQIPQTRSFRRDLCFRRVTSGRRPDPQFSNSAAQGIRCDGRGLGSDPRRRKLPTLDSPSPYKPLWTPGGFSPAAPPGEAGERTRPEDNNEPKTEEEWLEREAENAVKRQERLEQLRNQLGTWHERVRSMRILQRAGDLSAEEVADEARLVGLDSTKLMVAGSVHDSLTDVEPDVLKRFDEPDGPVVLYEFRTLSVAQRAPVAEYVVANGLGADEARELVKAVKDHERRPEGREGFTEAPGDTLAFWYFRNAIETREPEKKARLLEKAAAVAETESAKERVADSIDKSS